MPDHERQAILAELAGAPPPPMILERNRPGDSFRTWPIGGRPYDPDHDRLLSCYRCERKTGGTVLSTLRIWRVRAVRPGETWDPELGKRRPTEGWNTATVHCADQAECQAHMEAKMTRQERARKARRPDLPNRRAGAGNCKWCGKAIRLDKRRKGWKRRRTRSYHRGDVWECAGQPTDCLVRSLAWMDPKRATQLLLDRQGGRCNICKKAIAVPRELDEMGWYDSSQMLGAQFWILGPGPESLRGPEDLLRAPTPDLPDDWKWAYGRSAVDIDHVNPIWNGGTNDLDNLQAICSQPCHKAKTKREAAERAALRRAAKGEAEPLVPAPQMTLDSAA